MKSKDLLFVDYPVAQSMAEAVEWFEKGGELWQEISDEYPECTQLESLEDLKELEDITADDNIHMVDTITTKCVEILEGYINGNIHWAREQIEKLSKLELIELIEKHSIVGLGRHQVIELIRDALTEHN